MYRVLVVGERSEEAKALAFRLGLLGFEAAPSASAVTLALRSLFAFRPDALVLDIADCAERRELFAVLEMVAPVPIFVLGDGRSDELVWFLEQGAADYLAKPVAVKLLSARLNAVLRRLAENGHGTIPLGDLVISLDRHQVLKGGDTVQLTTTEFRLLQVLAENAGRPCSHEMLLLRVWGEDYKHCAHYLRLYVGYLRQKLEDDPRNPRLILTEWGTGYRLVRGHGPAIRPAARAGRVAWA